MIGLTFTKYSFLVFSAVVSIAAFSQNRGDMAILAVVIYGVSIQFAIYERVDEIAPKRHKDSDLVVLNDFS